MSQPLARRERIPLRPWVATPVGFREWLQRLGPTFIKIGQYLAMRPDLIAQEYCDELMLLFDRVPPFPWSEARLILQEDLRVDPREVFEFIDPVPFAAGSIAQTHLARLDDGTEVAVKVQRPNILKLAERDLARARLLARVLEISGMSFIVSPQQVVDELTEWIRQEIDFQHELANLTLLHRLAARSPIEKIPRPYPELSAGRVLTMELVRGVAMSEILGRRLDRLDGDGLLAEEEIDRDRVAANLIRATLRQIFRYQFFHADLHPGNLFILPNGVIGYVDFGLCDSWDGTMRYRLLRYLSAVYSGEVELMYRALSETLIPGEHTDMSAFRADFLAESRRWTSQMRTSRESRVGSPQRGPSPIAQWMIAVMQAARRNDLHVPPMLISIYRALLVAENVANSLDAEVDLRLVGRDFFERLQVDEAIKALDPQNLQPSVLSYVSLLRDAPGQLNQILAELSDGTFAITVYAEEPPRVARVRNRRVRVVVSSILFVGVAVLLTRPDLPDVEGLPLTWLLGGLLVLIFLWINFQLRGLR